MQNRPVAVLVHGLLPIAAALLIWFLGPTLQVAGERPLESILARVLTIIAIAVLWRKPLRTVAAMALAVRAGVRDAGLPAGPWFVVIGAPGSGKTTVLKHSGLSFSLSDRPGMPARGIGDAGNCDWWVSPEAVFIETAGRFTRERADGVDSGWWKLIALLRRHRRRRLLAGVIVTKSAHELLVQRETSRHTHLIATRRRLRQLNEAAGEELPVFVAITKCDLLGGFVHSFDRLSDEERRQPWVVPSRPDPAAADAFREAFDSLVRRLNGELFAKRHDQTDPSHGAFVFAFPQQFSALREPLAQYLGELFPEGRQGARLSLRGVYLTSAVQEGAPINQLLPLISPGRQALAGPGQGGVVNKGYFIEGMFSRLVDIARAHSTGDRRLRSRRLQMTAAAAVAGLALISVTLWSVSYRRNQSYVEAVAADLSRLPAAPSVSGATSLEIYRPRLDALRAVVDSAARYAESPPVSMRWGLSQAGSLATVARDAYARELYGSVLPFLERLLRQRLIDYSAQPVNLYTYLRAYLMLGAPEHLDKEALRNLADSELASLQLNAGRAVWSRHLDSVLDDLDRLPPLTLDRQLIAQARSTLRSGSVPLLAYRYLVIDYRDDSARALRIDRALGSGAERVFRRKSGDLLSDPFSSVFTKAVFEEIATTKAAQIVGRFDSEYWVWGDARPSLANSQTLLGQVMDVYERDYIDSWDRLIDDMVAAPLVAAEDVTGALAILSGTASPLRGLLRTIDDNTYFAGTPAPTNASIVASPPGTNITAHFEPFHRVLAGESGTAPIEDILSSLRQLNEKLITALRTPNDPGAVGAVADLVELTQQKTLVFPPIVRSIVTAVTNRARDLTR